MRIIVADEKHEEDYWDASTPELWAASALSILTERLRSDYWYRTADEMFGEKQELLTDEQIEALPTEHLREVAKREAAQITTSLRDRADYETWYAAVQDIVEKQDTGFVGRGDHRRPRAWAALKMHDDYEYEYVELVNVRSPDGVAK